MKKCSTAAVLLAAALSLPAHAERGCAFAPGAPDVHRVQRGDTLWDIASLFLQNPWCWPQVWEDNRAQVANPHRIYPGQHIVLDRQAGRLRTLTAESPTGMPLTVRLTPAMRISVREPAEAIPVVAPALLQSIARFRLAEPLTLAGTASIHSFADGRRMASPGDTAFVAGRVAIDSAIEIVRTIGPVDDPDTGVAFAHPLLRIGSANPLQRPQRGLQRIRLGSTRREVMAGDLLLPVAPDAARDAGLALTSLRLAPACDGKIAALMDERGRGGAGDVVLLNRGRRAGLERGHLMAVSKHARIGADDNHPDFQTMADPIATLLVFDVVEHSALALVLRSRDAVSRGDRIGAFPLAD